MCFQEEFTWVQTVVVVVVVVSGLLCLILPPACHSKKKEGHFILKYPKMVAFSTSRPRKQSRLRESQYFCVTFIKGKTEACRVTDQNVTLDARAARMHKTT